MPHPDLRPHTRAALGCADVTKRRIKLISGDSLRLDEGYHSCGICLVSSNPVIRPNNKGNGAVNDESFGWSVVIPLKPADVGKSRLGTLGPERVSFARAIALDTIDSVVSCPRVGQLFVVTADESLTRMLSGFRGTTVVGDTAIGLNSAIEQGLSVTPASSPRAVLLGDLPALQPSELTAALSVAGHYANTFIRDADGNGTTCITAAPGVPLTPAFGPGSAAAHRAAGYVETLLPPTSGLRRDVDTEEHLIAISPRLGRRTAALFDELRIASPAQTRSGGHVAVPDPCGTVHDLGWMSCR